MRAWLAPLAVLTAYTLTLALTLAAPPAHAEEGDAHYETSLVAWSADGASALVAAHATEANGATEYAVEVIGGAKRGSRYVLSSIPKPTARKPQKVSEKKCVKTLARLKKDLDKRGFEAVNVATACTKREALVTAGEQASARAADTWFTGEGTRLSRGTWAVELVRNTLTVKADGKVVGTWADSPQYLRLRATLSPSSKLLVVFHEWLGGNSSIALAAYTKTGAPADLKELRR